MIQNIVFDMGGVLLHFDPALFVSRVDASPEDRALLLEAVFHNPLWIEMDRGTATEAEAYADMCRRLPRHLHGQARALLYWWQDILPMEGMEALIWELKAKGYGLYVLSNAPTNLHAYFSRIPGADCMDGLVVSADHHLLKPQRELYEVLLNKYRLRPETCFFIDDMPANVEGARAAGMSAARFTGDAAQLRSALRLAGVCIS
ncbi:MAG: HAD family phosphatase [Eubacteriales bacterium]|nr:HAD family phosphatase [Eubacteriales bacterium]